MARRRIIISSSGGIAAGSPFVLGGGLFVQQASPPVAFTQRLALTEPIDANEGIEAPGILAGVGSFVLGRAVKDVAVGARSILIGDTITPNSTGGAASANDQVMIGSRIVVDAGANNSTFITALGTLISFIAVGGQKSFGGTVAIGANVSVNCSATTGAINVVAIGSQASVTESSGVAVGAGATVTKTEGIAIGAQSGAGSQGIGIGVQANGGTTSVAIGRGAKAGTDTVSVGFGATTVGRNHSIAIGRNADASGADDALAIGESAISPVANACLIGGRTPRGYTEFVFGQGYNDATGNVAFVWRTTDLFAGSGNNATGNGLILRAGNGTGNWANTENLGLDLQVGIAGASSSNRQVYASGIALRQSDLNIAMWGGLTANFAGGKKCLFIANGTTAPAGAVVGGVILYVVAGQLFGIGAAGIAALIVP